MSYSQKPEKAYLAFSLIAIFFVCLMASCTPAVASDVEDVFKTETVRIPHTQQVCEDVYHGGDKSGDMLRGAIIGGILGKALTGDDKGAGFGALVGAMGSAEKKNQSSQKIVGYETRKQCGVFYQEESIRKIKNYRITYEWMGIRGSSYTYNNYSIGARIPVNVSINAK